MRHREAAAVWFRLQEASDLEHILRECVADITMIVIRNENPIPEHRLSSIVLCKFIFDHQRVYLNTTSSYLDSINFRNIPLDVTLDTLSCLSSAAKATQQARGDANLHSVLLHLRQSFLAGLRCVLLSPLTLLERIRAGEAIYGLIDSWSTEPEVDSCVTTLLINSAALQLTGKSDDIKATFHLEKADRYPSQFLLDTKDIVLSKLRLSAQAAKEPKCMYMPDIIWLWVDSRLALITASCQYLFEDTTQGHYNSFTSNEDIPEALQALRSLASRFQSVWQKLPAALCDKIDLVEPTPHCHGCSCGCFETDDDQCSEICLTLSTRLANLGERLDNRKLATFNSSAEMIHLINFITSRRDDFVSNHLEDDSFSSIHEGSTERSEQLSLKASYMLDCRRMHCVSGDTLRGWIKKYSEQVKGLDELSRESELVETHLYCPICHTSEGGPSKSLVSLARKITPLSQILDRAYSLQNEVLKLQASRSASNTFAEEVDNVYDPLEPLQQGSDQPAVSQRSLSMFESSRNTDATNSIPSSGYKDRTSKIIRQEITNTTKIPFSTLLTPDGRHVFIWYRTVVAVFNTEVKRWITQWNCESKIRKFSASNKYFAATVNTAMGTKIFVQSLLTGNNVILPLELRRQARSICLSPDGTKLLVSLGQHVRYIPLSSGEPQSQTLPQFQDEDVESQCVSFSVGGERAVIATRLKDSGTVYINILDTSDPRKLPRVVNLCFNALVPITNIRDFGLTQCPCYFDERDKTTTWMVCSATSATNSGSQRMMQYKETNKPPKENFQHVSIAGRGKDEIGPSIIQAICLSASRDFLLIDDLHHVYVVQRSDRAAQWTSSRFTLKHNIRSSVTSIRYRVAVAANSVQQICIATVYDGFSRQFVYNTQSGRGQNDPKNFPIELEHY